MNIIRKSLAKAQDIIMLICRQKKKKVVLMVLREPEVYLVSVALGEALCSLGMGDAVRISDKYADNKIWALDKKAQPIHITNTTVVVINNIWLFIPCM